MIYRTQNNFFKFHSDVTKSFNKAIAINIRMDLKNALMAGKNASFKIAFFKARFLLTKFAQYFVPKSCLSKLQVG